MWDIFSWLLGEKEVEAPAEQEGNKPKTSFFLNLWMHALFYVNI